MRQHKDSFGTVLPCVIFGLASLPAQTPLFHFQLEDGGIWWRMPISAFCHKPEAKPLPLTELVLWDSFSYDVSVIRFDWLTNARMEYVSRTKQKYWGRYLFTIDWADSTGSNFAEVAGQHKCGHVIELANGNYAIQPNNRLLAFNPSFTTKFGQSVIERLISDRIYTVEANPKWMLPSDERYDYAILDTEENIMAKRQDDVAAGRNLVDNSNAATAQLKRRMDDAQRQQLGDLGGTPVSQRDNANTGTKGPGTGQQR